MKLRDRTALQDWDSYRKNIKKSTSIPVETEAEKAERIKRQEADPEEWFKFYFPLYCGAPSAEFHKKATKRLLKHNRWYEVRAWSRELAKSTRSMFEVLYLAMTGKIKNILLVSYNWDNASNLLMPFMINLEDNDRLVYDYGIQKGYKNWETGNFITRNGVSFRAIGAGQSPRGTKNEYARPDFILIDDLDEDEVCRNPERLKARWQWVERALIPTVSISGNYRFLYNGNIIAKDCCILRAVKIISKKDSKIPGHFEIVNIRDENGRSSWPEKNSEDDIDTITSAMSYHSVQQEYYNNPITEGTVFSEMRWDTVPPLHKFRFLVAYGDPAPSNRENKSTCYKTVPLIGELNGVYYIITCFLDHVKNSEFVQWFYYLKEYVKDQTQIYNYIENNSLQDPFYQQVFMPLFFQAGMREGHFINVIPDERDKPDKFARIEGNLDPIHRQGRLIFNIKEKNNPHMIRLEEQFEAVEPKLSAHVDGPDAVEGGIWIINNKLIQLRREDVDIIRAKSRDRNNHVSTKKRSY